MNVIAYVVPWCSNGSHIFSWRISVCVPRLEIGVECGMTSLIEAETVSYRFMDFAFDDSYSF